MRGFGLFLGFNGGAGDAYAVLGYKPELAFDFAEEYYRANSAVTTFSDALTFARASSATYVDSTGTLQTASSGVARVGHHIWNGTSWVNAGLLLESEARTNLLHTTDALVTQSLIVTAVPHTLHFTGTGTVTLLGASTAGPLVGTGTGENNRVSLTFTPTAASLTLTVTGTVTNAQLEVGSTPSSYISNLAASGSVTRAAETLTIPSAKLPWPAPNVIGPELVTNGTFDSDLTGWTDQSEAGGSIAWNANGIALTTGIDGTQEGRAFQTITTVAGKVYRLTATRSGAASRFDVSGVNSFGAEIYISPTDTSAIDLVFVATSATTYLNLRNLTAFNSTAYIDNISVREIDPLAVSIQMQGRATGSTLVPVRWYLDANNYITQEINTIDFTFEQAASGTIDAVTGGSFTSGVNTSFNIASRHGSTFVNGAVDGTALTANTTPTALPNLSATDLSLAYSGGPMVLKSVRMWAADITDAGLEAATV